MSSVILTEADLREAVEYFRKQDAFVFDVEGVGEHRGIPHLSQLTWMSLAANGTAIAVPFGHPRGTKVTGEKPETHHYKTGKKIGEPYTKMVPVYEDPPDQISLPNVFEILRPLFWEPGIRKIGSGVIYDLVSTAKYWGEVPPPPYGDTIVKKWLLDENIKKLGLKAMIKKHFGVEYDYDDTGQHIETVPFDKAALYSYLDAKYTWLYDRKLEPLIDEEGLGHVYEMEMDVLNVLVGMRLHGAKMDIPRLRELKEELEIRIVQAEAEVYASAGRRFNINSVPQRQKILFAPKPEGQNLNPWKITKGGAYSTDDDVLASYTSNPVAKALRNYGDVNKLLSTYVEGWLGDGKEKPCIIFDNHIYADFVQYGTVTGRFSCRKPNLQNIPRPYTELGALLRGAFIAETGGKLVVGDYAQIELVILAHYIGEGKLFEAFQTGIDPHTMTAAMVLGKAPEDVTKVERQDLGKTLGFAVVYGAGDNKVANMAHVSVKRAREVLARHAEMFPEIHAFKQYTIDYARKYGYLETLIGRKRRVKGLKASEKGIRLGAERQAFNSLIQGGAADLIKLSMIRVDAMIPEDVHLTMTVHDEIVLASPESLAQSTVGILREAMTGEGVQRLVNVPLKADIHIADRWSEAK
jgi:DNA polymerase I-like protein with 3'-5' exonuclease and polymerase domains